MGASQITDEELRNLDIDILQDEEATVRKLTIPTSSIEQYKDLIRSKLDNGFLNEYVGEDQIYFIFKMPDGVVKEFTYNETNRFDIAKRCSQLNGDAIEKTSNILDYIAENEFYTEIINNYKKNHGYHN